MLLCLASAGGCGWITSLWPRGQKSVPVTRPVDKGEQLTFEDRAAAQTPDPEDPPAKAESRPDPQPGGAEDPDGTDEPDPNRPIPLETVGAEPEILQEETIVAASVLPVGDSFITAEDILTGAAMRLSRIPTDQGHQSFVNQVREIIRQELRLQISLKLVLPEAEGSLNEQQEELLDKQVLAFQRDWIAEAGGSKQALETRLKEAGTTLDAQLMRRRSQILVQSYVSEKFNSAVVINRRKLWDYYRSHPEEFSSQKQVQMQLIAAPFDAFQAGGQQAQSEARELIESAAKALKEGMAFDEAVAKFSRGVLKEDKGIWPVMKRGSLRQKQLEDTAFALRQGQVSQIVQTPEGYYIVRAHKITEGETVSFLDAQKQIENTLRQQQVSELSEEYYGNLYKQAERPEQPQFLEEIVHRAVARYYPS
jgi:hypothetical protein